jgi:hypothetical protein
MAHRTMSGVDNPSSTASNEHETQTTVARDAPVGHLSDEQRPTASKHVDDASTPTNVDRRMLASLTFHSLGIIFGDM